jgi:hypothetical protein
MLLLVPGLKMETVMRAGLDKVNLRVVLKVNLKMFAGVVILIFLMIFLKAISLT